MTAGGVTPSEALDAAGRGAELVVGAGRGEMAARRAVAARGR